MQGSEAKPGYRSPHRACVVLGAVVVLWGAGCGGKTTVAGGSTVGSGGTTGAGGSTGTGGSTPDLPPMLCAGDVAKVQLGNQLISPAVVTTMELALMSCCQVSGVRFHTRATLGFDVVAILRAWGMFETGEHDVADPGGLIEAYVLNAPVLDLPWPEQEVAGTVEVLDAYGSDQPWHVGLCLQLDAPGDALDALQLYVPSATVMPFSWAPRWGFWLLSDPSMDAVSAAQLPLSSLALGPVALDLMSIAYYREGDHRVGFGDIEGMIPALEQHLPPVGVNGVPFVVQADGDRIYLGAFMTQLSSVLFDGPVVVVEEIADQGFPILAPPMGDDSRGDPRIIQVMAEAGKLTP